MKLQSQSSKALAESLQEVSKCISSKNSMSIMDNVLLTCDANGRFFFTTASMGAQLSIPAPLSLIGGTYEHPLAFPAAGMIAYLSTLPVCVVNLTFDNKNNVNIDYCIDAKDKAKTGKFSIPCFDGREFPTMQDVSCSNAIRITLPGSLFASALDSAAKFTANDELRVVLNGLCIDVVEDCSECRLVATDGHSLIKYTHTNNPATGGSNFYQGGNPRTLIISNKNFKPLSVFNRFSEVHIESDGNTIRVSAEETNFLCKAIEGKFPNYNSVIPKNTPFFVTVDKKEMLSVVKRVNLFGSASTNLVKMRKEGMFLNISAEDIDFSTNATDQVFISDSQCEDGFYIGLNAGKFANALAAIDSPVIKIHISSKTTPCVITSDEASPIVLTLCMPMLIE